MCGRCTVIMVAHFIAIHKYSYYDEAYIWDWKFPYLGDAVTIHEEKAASYAHCQLRLFSFICCTF